MDNEKKLKVCQSIIEDMEKDAENSDGMPFTGKTVGIMCGNLGAAIAALALVVKSIIQEKQD